MENAKYAILNTRDTKKWAQNKYIYVHLENIIKIRFLNFSYELQKNTI